MIEFTDGADFLASLPGMFALLFVVFVLSGIGGNNNVYPR